MVVPGNSDTAYHSSPRVSTAPGWCRSVTFLVTTAVSPIMPETPFSIADSCFRPRLRVHIRESELSLTSTIRPRPNATHQIVTRRRPTGSEELHPAVGCRTRGSTTGSVTVGHGPQPVSYTHLRAHETDSYL